MNSDSDSEFEIDNDSDDELPVEIKNECGLDLQKHLQSGIVPPYISYAQYRPYTTFDGTDIHNEKALQHRYNRETDVEKINALQLLLFVEEKRPIVSEMWISPEDLIRKFNTPDKKIFY